MRLRAGIIGSSGGSALAAAWDCVAAAGHRLDLAVVTDRPCGMETWARRTGQATKRIAFANAARFSVESYDYFDENGCASALLFYTRLVRPPAKGPLRVWNVHPSLLPAFPGLGAVGQAHRAKVRVLGATVHEIDAGVDTGPIVGQIATSLGDGSSLAAWQHISFVHKVFLTLLWFEWRAGGSVGGPAQLSLACGPTVVSSLLSDRALAASFMAWDSALQAPAA